MDSKTNQVSSLKDFEMLNKLGQGAFGQVFKVKRKADNKEYAMKKVKLGAMKEKERQNAVNEIRILASLNDQYIIGYKDAFLDETSSTLCVVMEYASGGDLLKKINNHVKARTKFPEDEIWKALVHMTKGLKSLHDVKILHRDLKCANVFINNQGVYKLGDLNVSKVLKQGMAHTQTGTPYYASPEVWSDQPYDMKSDMWSLGCVIYEMAALKPPFTATDLQGLYKKVKAGVYDRIPSSYSNDLSIVIGMLLKVNPGYRPNADQLLGNSIVAKHAKGEVLLDEAEDDKAALLNTIKFNPKQLGGLKGVLPKANYEGDHKKQQPPVPKVVPTPPTPTPPAESASKQLQKNAPNSSSRKDIMQERTRQRVLSACGVRPPSYCESPKIAVHNKNEQPGMKKEEPYKKMLEMNNNKNAPPKNPQPPVPSPLYKLPPKPAGNLQPPTPSYHQPSSANRVGSVNASNDDSRSRGMSRQKSRDKINPNQGLYQQYINAVNNPTKPVSSNGPSQSRGTGVSGANSQANKYNQRPSSAAKVQVQPSWWG